MYRPARVLIVALCFITLFVATFFPLNSDDLFMYLALGRRLLDGGLPSSDPFLLLGSNTPWHVSHEWGAYVYYFFIYQVGGFTALIAMNALLLTGMGFLAALPAIRQKNFLPLLVLPPAVYAGSLRFSPKASIFSDFFTLLLVVLSPRQLPCRSPRLWRLVAPVFFVLWANLHPGFLFGLGILGLMVLDRILQRDWIGAKILGQSLALSLLACLFNPLGPEGFLYPLQRVLSPDWAIFRDHFLEWMPTFVPGSLQVAEVWALLWVWLITALVLMVNLIFKGWKEKPFLDLVFFAFFVFLGSNAVRFMLLSSLVSFALFCRQLVQLPALQNVGSSAAAGGAAGLLQLALLTSILTFGYPTYVGPMHPGFGISQSALPELAADFLESHPFPGNIFNETDWGSYLAWRWDGTRKVFYHGHIDDPSFLQREFLAAYRTPEEFENLVRTNNIGVFLLRQRNLVDGGPMAMQNLIAAMRRGLWRMVYQDDLAVIVIRQPTTEAH
ncbi:MAG: hypothetical protein C5B49_02950 [Bdellovibrio sp.]|nr:MAG: hypothetical protein C5B49_02950 [Bdellovibrio sp.]